MKHTLAIASLLALCTLNVNAENADTTQTTNKTAIKAAEVIDNLAGRIHINGYMQGGYDYQSSDNQNSFNFKRAIVWAKADITDRWSFTYMHDFKASSLEYYTAYRVHKALNLRLGQFKTSLSMENPMSPSKLELIDSYSQPVKYLVGFTDPLIGAQGGRDLGFLVYGDICNTGLKYELAVMNGQGINKNDGNSDKDYAMKLDYRILKPLRIVVSGQLGRGHAIANSPFAPAIQQGDNYKRNRVTAGAEYVGQHFSLRSEWLKGWDGPYQSQGVYATAMKNLCKTVDAVASYSWLDRNSQLNARQSNYTVGLQYWFYKKCRIQVQYTRWCPSFAKDYNLIQLQTQVGF